MLCVLSVKNEPVEREKFFACGRSTGAELIAADRKRRAARADPSLLVCVLCSCLFRPIIYHIYLRSRYVV